VDLSSETLETGGGGEVAQTMYIYVSKCKNDKRRKKEKKHWRLKAMG
jgi:hypothetical protein